MLKNRQISRICRKKHKPRVKPAKITYLQNAAGQRVFKSEPQFAQSAQAALDAGFITWLKKNFGWLYATAQTNATLGQSYVYADGPLPEYALLAEYGNGAASGSGRLEYIWLPTESGQAIPIGVYRGSRFYAIHADHLNTPRLMTDDSNKAVWQWPYSAFGDNKPTGILKAITNPNNAVTQDVTTNARLKATSPAVKFNLRYPGQYFDEESNLNQNFNRSYQFGQGRYSQTDPIGLAGGLNRFGYANQNPLSFTDPFGLMPSTGAMPNSQTLKHCPDPCAVIEAAVAESLAAVKKAWVALYYDMDNLFNNAWGVPVPGTNTTWVGHLTNFKNLQRQLGKQIQFARQYNCKIDPEAVKWEHVTPPMAPNNPGLGGMP